MSDEEEKKKEEIANFFEGVIINGISRDVIFPEMSQEGCIEIDLVAPPQVGIPPVHLSFPPDLVP